MRILLTLITTFLFVFHASAQKNFEIPFPAQQESGRILLDYTPDFKAPEQGRKLKIRRIFHSGKFSAGINERDGRYFAWLILSLSGESKRKYCEVYRPVELKMNQKYQMEYIWTPRNFALKINGKLLGRSQIPSGEKPEWGEKIVFGGTASESAEGIIANPRILPPETPHILKANADGHYAVKKGDILRLVYQYEETSADNSFWITPHLAAFDSSGKLLQEKSVGVAVQRVFVPDHPACCRYQVFAEVSTDEKKDSKYISRFSRGTHTLPPTTASIQLSFRQSGNLVKIANPVYTVEKIESVPPFPRQNYPELPPVRALQEGELDAALQKQTRLTPELRLSGTRTILTINGKEMLPVIYKNCGKECPNRIAATSEFAKEGFNIFVIPLKFGIGNPNPLWKADGSVDAESLRHTVRQFLAVNPNGCFMLELGMTPHSGFAQENPDEIYRNEKGEAGIFEAARIRSFGALREDSRRNIYPAISYTSEKFAKEASAALSRLFADFEKMPESRHVIGVYLNGFTDGQWLDLGDNSAPGGPRAADYSVSAKKGFPRFLKEKYGTLETLRQAWKQSGLLSFEAVQIPPASDFWNAKRSFHAVHQATPMSDFHEYMAHAAAALRLKLAEGVKKGSSRRLLVGSYSPNGGLAGYPLISQCCTWQLLQSPHFDFFAVVPEYRREYRDPVVAAAYDASIRRHNKLLITELDLRTGEVGNWGHWGSAFWRAHHNAKTFENKVLRFTLQAVTRGGSFHAYDMDGGWFNTDNARKAWRNAIRIVSEAEPVSETENRIAVVGSERFWDFQSFGKGRLFAYAIRETAGHVLPFSGVPFDFYMLEDVLKDSGLKLPKIVIFNDLGNLTVKQFEMLQKRFASEGRILVYWWRPGVFAPDGDQLDQYFSLERRSDADGQYILADPHCTDPLMEGIRNRMIGYYPSFGFERVKIFAPKGNNWKCLARFEKSDAAGLAVRRHRNFTEIFAALPSALTPQFCRNLAKAAGFEPWIDTDDISGFGSKLFYISAQTDGVKKVVLPSGHPIDRVLTGHKIIQTDDYHFQVSLKRGEVFVLKTR